MFYGRHATTIIIDRQNKTISRWDPHGKNSSKLPDSEFLSVIAGHSLFDGYKLLTPGDLSDANRGIQIRTHYNDEEGRCFIWMLYFMELSIAHPEYTAQEISKMLDTKYSLVDLINSIEAYTKWYHDMNHGRDNPHGPLDMIKLDEIQAKAQENKKKLVEAIKEKKMKEIETKARKINAKVINVFNGIAKQMEVVTERAEKNEKAKNREVVDLSDFFAETQHEAPLSYRGGTKAPTK